MARAIDKRIMLDLIIEAKKTDPETGPFSEWLAEYLVDHLPTLTQPNEWVSVEDRLPPPNVRVLAYRPGEGDNSPYKYTNMWGWAVKESIRHKGITHWMYYPAPPDRRPPEGL